MKFIEIYLSKIDSTDTKDLARAGKWVDYLLNDMKSDSIDEKAIQDMSKVKEDIDKKLEMTQSNTFNDIIQETQRYIKEIENVQAVKNDDMKSEGY